jgi:hypothetical protein
MHEFVYTTKTVTTVRDIYGKTAKELEAFLEPEQKFVAFRLPLKDELVLFSIAAKPWVTAWPYDTEGKTPRLIVETTPPAPPMEAAATATACTQCENLRLRNAEDTVSFKQTLEKERQAYADLQEQYYQLQATAATDKPRLDWLEANLLRLTKGCRSWPTVAPAAACAQCEELDRQLAHANKLLDEYREAPTRSNGGGWHWVNGEKYDALQATAAADAARLDWLVDNGCQVGGILLPTKTNLRAIVDLLRLCPQLQPRGEVNK